jgi:hypothetical protein
MEIIMLIILAPFVGAAFICEGTIWVLILFCLFPLLLLTLLIANIGILNLKEWSRKLLIYVALLGITLCVINIIFLEDTTFISPIISVILVLAIYYFTRPQVKRQF